MQRVTPSSPLTYLVSLSSWLPVWTNRNRSHRRHHHNHYCEEDDQSAGPICLVVPVAALPSFPAVRTTSQGTPTCLDANHCACLRPCAGPLGTGICNAIGIAVAEANLAARFNKPDAPKLIDHYTGCIFTENLLLDVLSCLGIPASPSALLATAPFSLCPLTHNWHAACSAKHQMRTERPAVLRSAHGHAPPPLTCTLEYCLGLLNAMACHEETPSVPTTTPFKSSSQPPLPFARACAATASWVTAA
eukprot:356534-Chlamydomonas_euryale.AAC.7